MENEEVTMKRVIIDTDPGIDDTAAIFLALASPKLHVEALTTVYGNGTMAACTRNALIILETAGRSDIPVSQVRASRLWEHRTTARMCTVATRWGIRVPPPV